MPYCWVFNFVSKSWTSSFFSKREYFNLNSRVFSWSFDDQKVYEEGIVSLGVPEFDSLVAIPFNDNYPLVKSPLSLKLDATTAPSEVWIVANTNTRFDLGGGDGSIMVANISDWKYREGDWYCYILRDRMSKGGNFLNWDARGLNGTRLKGKQIYVVLVWKKEQGTFSATSCALSYE